MSAKKDGLGLSGDAERDGCQDDKPSVGPVGEMRLADYPKALFPGGVEVAGCGFGKQNPGLSGNHFDGRFEVGRIHRLAVVPISRLVPVPYLKRYGIVGPTLPDWSQNDSGTILGLWENPDLSMVRTVPSPSGLLYWRGFHLQLFKQPVKT